MKVTCVGIKPTSDHEIGLTPEQLAATGARYSRNNEGLQTILDKTLFKVATENGHDDDSVVDSIFKMVDYGHRSIADMAPVAMFIDDVSLWMALRLWSWCPTAGGQESSTRYIKLKPDAVVKPPQTNLAFDALIESSFDAYDDAYNLWGQVAEKYPDLVGIPEDVKGKKLVRMQRNFAFDRARYFLPMCCQTNVMLVMSGRAWTDLIKMLYSDLNAESVELAEQMSQGLELSTPRLTRHARFDESYSRGATDEFEHAVKQGHNIRLEFVGQLSNPSPYCQIIPPVDVNEADIVEALEHHDGRYDYFGPAVRRTTVRFGWNALTIAELRDLNRHRTGTKEFNLVPTGSYFADDQVDLVKKKDPQMAGLFKDLRNIGERMTQVAHHQLLLKDPAFVYYLPLGAQCRYEHVTTADKFLYQCELRTGLGAHYTYAARMREVLSLWHSKFPRTKTMIRPGTAEPE